MALAAEDIEFIKEHLGEWLAQQSLGKPPAVYEIELRERMVRVEEELKHQRELIKTILVEMDKRFEAMDKRFDSVEKRFEAIDKRFDSVDKRLDSLDKRLDLADKRLDSVDKRFEAMEKRFEAFDKRFEELTRRIDRFMFWSFGLTVSVGALIIAAVKLWP
ncbi:MAG: hypothetical protein JZU52_15255 [Lamprocystis purpurea]|jgi:chromosome segregation ATPase|uniref:hypothetical protein n=1 Tax=Lamprocystis purpurea TaxID=61598 RepID=UPI00035E533F|nr:hypothetical protein [Lamprocystis purpurea]MBV5274935.1 hypothetical protein [Lamprocystis purpurea]